METASAGSEHIFSGFSIIHSNHMEYLRDLAVRWIRTHPLMPLENELFLVQSSGMAKWLQLSLAAESVAACIEMMLPGRFTWDLYSSVMPEDQIQDRSPYDRDILLWRLFDMIPKVMDEPGFSPLKKFLGKGDDQSRLYQLCDQISGLFDQYQVYRADWLEDWEAGKNQIKSGSGKEVSLEEDHLWQPLLWRVIYMSLPPELCDAGRASLHRRFLAEIKNMERPRKLPRRVIVFGISSLPRQTLELLHSISDHCQVLMFVHNPCRHYWADIIEDRDLLKIENARHKAKTASGMDKESMHQHVNPLLASWGKQGRDYIGLLYGYDRPDSYRENFKEIDLFDDYTDDEPSLLCQVQQAVLDLVPLPDHDGGKTVLDAEDSSIMFRLAHSCQREVEILQDHLLSFFEEIEDLKPADIIVMVPDIEKYAAQVEAVFGRLPVDDARYIPYTIADREQRASNPLLIAFEKLLSLPDSRMGVSDISALLEVEPFRRRFGIADGDLPGLNAWIGGAGIRWGLNSEHRESLGLPSDLDQNTWFFGLRRMLLGYAVGGGAPWRGIEPYGEVGGLEAFLAGALSSILETLEKFRKLLETRGTVDQWCTRIKELLDECFLASENRDRIMLKKIEEALFQWKDTCRAAGLESEIGLGVVRDYLGGAVSESALSKSFLAGRVNFCSLMPMRAIPFKVVCLLGMNDGEYPRRNPPFDFDLMGLKGQYRPGDRSRRDDDRYLFLEALLSARRKLYISYIGRSQNDNSQRASSVLVGQFRDYLDAGWEYEDNGEGLSDGLTVQYPLQPFSRNYFREGSSLFTYSNEWRRMFDSPEGPVKEAPSGPVENEQVLSMADLIGFLKNPVQSFYNRRLGVYFNDVEGGTEDLESFSMDVLERFVASQHLLDAGLFSGAGTDAVDLAAGRLMGTGDLPMKGFGEIAAEDLASQVGGMIRGHERLISLWPERHEPRRVIYPLGKNLNPFLEDWIDRLQGHGGEGPLARWEFYPLTVENKSSLRAVSGFFSLWIKHICGCAAGIELQSHLITPDGCYFLEPVDRAADHLDNIICLFNEGMRLPLPVTAKTAFAYEANINAGDGGIDKAEEAARNAYEGNGYNFSGEVGHNSCLSRSYPDFNALFNDPERFAELSETLYRPILEAIREG